MNNATLAVAQRRVLRRINEDPIRVYGPNDDQRATKELERLGLIEQKEVPPRVEREWWITAAGVVALDGESEGCDDPNCPIHGDRVKAETQAELELLKADDDVHGTATGRSPWSAANPRHALEPLAELKHVDVLLLLKQPEDILRMIPSAWLNAWPAHVWVGTTAEDQPSLDERVPHLLRVPAVRFLSVLGPVDLENVAGPSCGAEGCVGGTLNALTGLDVCGHGYGMGGRAGGIDWVLTKAVANPQPPKEPAPWAQVVQALAALGWTVDAVRDEFSRQWDEALAARPDEPIPPGTFIHDEGGEEPPEDEEVEEPGSPR